MPANQKKTQVVSGDNSDSKDGKCPKQTQRGRKKKTDSKGPDNVDPPKKRRGKKAGNEAERTKKSPKDPSPVTKDAETVVASSTEPDLSVFPMSQANKFIPRFGKPTKKKSSTDSTVGSAAKSPDKVKDESLCEHIGEMIEEQSNCVGDTGQGKEFHYVKLMVERLDITNDVADMGMEIAEENESKGVKRNDNVVDMDASGLKQDKGEALEQEFGKGKELTEVDEITPVDAQNVSKLETNSTRIQNAEIGGKISELQTSTDAKADGNMATSSNDDHKIEELKSKDGTEKQKKGDEKIKPNDSKDVAEPPCPVEENDQQLVISQVLGSCTGLGVGPAATCAETNNAVTTASEASHSGAGIQPPPVPAPTAAPSLSPTPFPALQEHEVENPTGSDTGCFSLLSLETDLHQVTDSTEVKDPAKVPSSNNVIDSVQVTDDSNSEPGKSFAPGNTLGVIKDPKAGIAPRAAQYPGAAPGQSDAGQDEVVVGSGPDLDLTDSQLEDLDIDMSLDPTQPDTKTSWSSKHSINQGNPVKLMTVVLPNLTPPKKKLPDATQKMKSLINELTALNNIVLKAKRDMEIFKRRRQQMAQAPEQQGNHYNMYGPY